MNLNEFQSRCLRTSSFDDAHSASLVDLMDKVQAMKDESENLVNKGLEEFSNSVETLNAVLQTLDDNFDFYRLTYLLDGLAGEAGEVIEKKKKLERNQDMKFATDEERHANPSLVSKHSLAMEISDILWYAMTTLSELDYSFEEIGNDLLNKLESRAKRGVIKSSGDER